jgi:ATP-dependent DNA ligase
VAKRCEFLDRPGDPQRSRRGGEIIALDNNGRISVNQLQPQRIVAQAILFYAFDVIIHRGLRLIEVTLENQA